DLKMAELADALGAEASSLSRAVAALVKRRLLKAVPMADKRERFFELTAAGREHLRGAHAHWEQAQEEVKRALGGARLAAFTASLDDVSADGDGAGASRRRAHSRHHA
ncbi:MAG TPA: winged helix DNA-binding protein, partial [Myxococcota bacterium]